MPIFLLVFEFLGTTELMVIALVALIIFGPRKLPEIGRTIGKSLAEFKRASDDFKRTWEYEVEIDSKKPALSVGPETHYGSDALSDGGGAIEAAGISAEEIESDDTRSSEETYTVARNASGAPAKSAESHEPSSEKGDDELNAS